MCMCICTDTYVYAHTYMHYINNKRGKWETSHRRCISIGTWLDMTIPEDGMMLFDVFFHTLNHHQCESHSPTDYRHATSSSDASGKHGPWWEGHLNSEQLLGNASDKTNKQTNKMTFHQFTWALHHLQKCQWMLKLSTDCLATRCLWLSRRILGTGFALCGWLSSTTFKVGQYGRTALH